MTDQTAKADAGKPRLTLVPRQIIFDIAKVRGYAVDHKYKDPDNWKRVEVQRYRDAAYRHFVAYLDDPKGLDAESGLSHLAHLATNVAFLCELEAEEPEQIVIVPHKELKRMAEGGLIAKEIKMQNLTFKDKICGFFAKFRF